MGTEALKADNGYSNELSEGVKAFRSQAYEKARLIFNRIIEQKIGSPDIEEAQWYLAQIAEKQGRYNEAWQQYDFFVKNFPSSPHVAEANERLKALINKRQGEPLQASPSRSSKRGDLLRGLSGSFTTEFLYDNLTSPSPSTTTQNRMSEYLDMRWKNRAGQDVRVYFSGFYSHSFMDREDERFRISKLFGEWNNVGSRMDLRLGRQPSSGNTLFSRFDGMAVSYQPARIVHLSGNIGFPVQIFGTDEVEVQMDRWFYETYLTLYDFHHLGGRLYYTEELTQDFSTRNAVGVNGYWINESVNLNFIVDYDLDFTRFNDELIGLEYARRNIRYFGAVEYRKNPYLDYNTALLDPSLVNATPLVTSLETLQQTRNRDEIRALALANTSESLEFRLGTAVDFTEIWHGDFRYSHIRSEVADFTAGRVDKTSNRVSMFFSERNGLNLSEVWTLLLLFEPATDYQTLMTVTSLSRYWRSGPLGTLRFRVERVDLESSGNQSTRYVPGLSLNYSLKDRIQFSLEGDYVVEVNSASPDPLNTIQTRTSLTIPF